MRSKTLTLAAVAMVLLTFGSSSRAQTVGCFDVNTQGWSTGAANNLAANPPSLSCVQQFVNLQPDDALNVCSFKFADLTHSGFLSLVTVLDGSGRGLCNEVAVFDKTSAGVPLTDITASPGEDASQIIQNLNGDGNLELVVDTDLTTYQGTRGCVAAWPVVYNWTGSTYANTSAQFTAFYQQTLQALNQQVGAPPSAGSNPDDADCLSIEISKVQRFLGTSGTAGLTDATNWAQSANPAQRERAANVLADIGTSAAVSILKQLTADPDPYVNTVANDCVAGMAQPPFPLIERVLPGQ